MRPKVVELTESWYTYVERSSGRRKEGTSTLFYLTPAGLAKLDALTSRDATLRLPLPWEWHVDPEVANCHFRCLACGGMDVYDEKAPSMLICACVLPHTSLVFSLWGTVLIGP